MPLGARLIAFNKPYNVLCQFRHQVGSTSLSKYIQIPGIYAAGRLDKDSEGLLLLTNDGRLNARITQPRSKMWKTYWVQVEGTPSEQALGALRQGVVLKNEKTKPARVKLMGRPPDVWDRDPPLNPARAHIPTAWIEISICEGKNRQVRRMTSAVDLPTIRLIRSSIGAVELNGLLPGQWREIQPEDLMTAAMQYKQAQKRL